MDNFFSTLQGVTALITTSLDVGVVIVGIVLWISKKGNAPFTKGKIVRWSVGCIAILLLTTLWVFIYPFVHFPGPVTPKHQITVTSSIVPTSASTNSIASPAVQSGAKPSIMPTSASNASVVFTPTPIPVPTISPRVARQPYSIMAPGCYGDNSLQEGQNIVFLCPPQNSGSTNPYNNFQAKDENLALADSTGNPFTLTGTIGVQSNTSCSSGCVVQGNILFHDEPADFRQATSFGIMFAGYGIALDRSGQVYRINRNSQGGRTTSLEMLTDFPTGNDLVANNNPINVQIQYVLGKNVFFQIRYKSGGQILKTSIDSGIPSVNLNIGEYNSSNILEVFVQNIVNPNQYSGEFQHSPIDFGDSSIIGLGEITITPN